MPEYPLRYESGLLLAHVRLGGLAGERLLRLALDTGATITMIPPSAALAIGLHPENSKVVREILTASGKEHIPIVVVLRLQIFEKTIRRISVACHDLPPESMIDGLLGLDVLMRLKAKIDLKKRTLSIP